MDYNCKLKFTPLIPINNQMIPYTSDVKYFGIHPDRRLTYKSYIESKLTPIKLIIVQLKWLIQTLPTTWIVIFHCIYPF